MKHVMILLAGATLCGCSSDMNPFARRSGNEQTAQLASYAAKSEYSTTQPAREDLAISAMIDEDELTLINGSSKDLHSLTIWVNGTYVTPLNYLPAHGTATIPRTKFYNSSGRSLSGNRLPVERVDIQTDEGYIRAAGPAYK